MAVCRTDLTKNIMKLRTNGEYLRYLDAIGALIDYDLMQDVKKFFLEEIGDNLICCDFCKLNHPYECTQDSENYYLDDCKDINVPRVLNTRKVMRWLRKHFNLPEDLNDYYYEDD